MFRHRPWICALGVTLVAAFGGGSDSWAGNDPAACDEPGEQPDVIVGELVGSVRWGTVGGITAFSVGTTSCNIGTCELEWQSNNSLHPVIGQNMYRLRDGRFEQIGQSWLKHGFFALSLELCDTGCVDTDGASLGPRCADPYGAGLNGDQGGLGPKFEVNATTGEYPYPPTDGALMGDAIYKRLQVHNSDLDPTANAGAIYYVEGHYVTFDDAAAQNQTNNASFRRVNVTGSGGVYNITLVGMTEREQPGIVAWVANDPGVTLTTVDVPGDGRFLVGSKASEVAPGQWSYEYAVQNLFSHRSMGAFRVPVPSGATVTNIGFHDVDYHSGEPYDGTDWAAEIVDEPGGRYIRWSTTPFDADPNANALRWSTLYNFRFVADIGPSTDPGPAAIGMFRPGGPDEVSADVVVPNPCNVDGICDPNENCETCPDCVGPDPQNYCCGDGVCDATETDCTCAADCGPCLIPCDVPGDCDDGLACNGTEDCIDGFCAEGSPLCSPRLICDEDTDSCLECVFSDVCDDGVFCTGFESCADNTCTPGADPCPGLICVEDRSVCAECLDDALCNDGLFCNGEERCVDDDCVEGFNPCSPGTMCDEQNDICVGCDVEGGCDDGQFCNGVETCLADECIPGTPPCSDVGQLCDELHNACTAPDALQPRPGEPLNGLTAEQLSDFISGKAAFRRSFNELEGLGPVYNGTACSDCHGVNGIGGVAVTRFGRNAGLGGFNPLESLGGSLLQTEAIRPECAETMPGVANVTSDRMSSPPLGAGVAGQIAEADLLDNANNPPPGVNGRVHMVTLLENPAVQRVGRFGWKAQYGSLLSAAADESVGQLGITNRVVEADHPPGGDADLLLSCDAVADPEEQDAAGPDYIDRVRDYLRYLAPPPQTPRFRMEGELRFANIGCRDCHTTLYTTPGLGGPDDPLGARTIRPYSDYLLHDMGDAGDPTAHGDAMPGEVRTAPLWGLSLRTTLWHDGRFDQPVFEDRVMAAIAEHAAPGSTAAASAQEFAALSTLGKNQILAFLASLGRAEFDADRDGQVDGTDFADFYSCFTGPGQFYDADDACAIHDVDADGDVDSRDYVVFTTAFDGQFGGTVPDGSAIPGAPLRINWNDEGELLLEWSASCLADDPDYAVYQGNIGDFSSHFGRRCSTNGATSTALLPPTGSAYFLIVPTNGVIEGSYGLDSGHRERTAAGGSLACATQWLARTCD